MCVCVVCIYTICMYVCMYVFAMYIFRFFLTVSSSICGCKDGRIEEIARVIRKVKDQIRIIRKGNRKLRGT